jgi:uncharacterized membrane protein
MIDLAYNAKAVKPVECFRLGWQSMRGRYWFFVGVTFIGVIIASLAPMAILLGPMVCGIYYCYLRKARQESLDFAMLFKGFDHFVDSLVATLVLIIPIFILMIPTYIITMVVVFRHFLSVSGTAQVVSPFDSSFLKTLILVQSPIFLLSMLLGFLMAILWSFAYPLIVDKKLKGIDALKLSAKAGLANWQGLLGLIILNWLLMIAGYAFCCVGFIFLPPFFYAAMTQAYLHVFPDSKA